MNVVSNLGGPRVIAIVEIDDSAESLADLRRILPAHVEIRECDTSPSGHRSLELLFEGTRGPLPRDDTTAMLTALELSSSIFQSFRIVDGDRWPRRTVAHG